TGQPITAYSTHYHGPRAGGELHIVLVDNGRSRLLGSEDFRSSLRCIRCAACLNTCPVYRRSGGHSYGVTIAGPLGSIVNTSREPAKHVGRPYACSLCGSCSAGCPVEIDLHNQLLTWRKHLVARGLMQGSKRRLMKLTGAVLRRPGIYATAGRIVRQWLRMAPRWMVYNRFNAWGPRQECRPPPRETFPPGNRFP